LYDNDIQGEKMAVQTQDLIRPLEKLRGFYEYEGRLPSFGEAAKLFGFSSRSSAVYLIDKLIERGFMKKGLKGRLQPTASFYDRLRVLGSVAAGFPLPEEEDLLDTLSLDDFLITKRNATYMLKVKGDSMKDAGILQGDYVIVEKGRSPKVGEVVIAQVDSEWTMKYYQMDKGKVYLEPANPDYSNIYPESELYIGGVVVSVCRRY
jgi:SOS regulatory protein LexA